MVDSSSLSPNPCDEGVSPVIGVILMVAIAVVLAAVVFVIVSGVGNESEAPRFPVVQVTGMTVPTDGLDATVFTIEHRAGACLNMAEYTFKARLDDVLFTLVSTGYSGPICVGDTFNLDESQADDLVASDAGRHVVLLALDGSSDALVYEASAQLAS